VFNAPQGLDGEKSRAGKGGSFREWKSEIEDVISLGQIVASRSEILALVLSLWDKVEQLERLLAPRLKPLCSLHSVLQWNRALYSTYSTLVRTRFKRMLLSVNVPKMNDSLMIIARFT